MDWFDPAYLEANTQDYGTGFIAVPAASVIPHGWLSAGLHRYQVKVNYGLWDMLEAGLSADVEGYTDLRNIPQKTLVYARLRVLRQDKHGISVAGGMNGLGWEDLGFDLFGFQADPAFQFTQVYYAGAGRTVPGLPSMVITAGAAMSPEFTQDFGGGFKAVIASESWFIANVSQVVFDGLMAMLEKDRTGINVGFRMLLSAEIKLDLALYQAQSIQTSRPFADVLDRNIRFGISYTEKWP